MTTDTDKLVETALNDAYEKGWCAAAQAAPFAKDSWQHAVDNQLVGLGRTSQEFANPHEAMAWLAEMHMELGVSNAGATQAVRMLTQEELEHCRLWYDGALNQQLGVLRKFCEVNAGRTIPADGKIGDAA